MKAVVQSQSTMRLEEQVAALEAENQDYARKCPTLEQLWRQYNEPFLKRAIELKEQNKTMLAELDQEFVIRKRDQHVFAKEHDRYLRACWQREGLTAQLDELRERIRAAEVHKVREVLPILEERQYLIEEIERRKQALVSTAEPKSITTPRRSIKIPSQTHRHV